MTQPRFKVLCMADLSAAPWALAPLREVAEVEVLPPDRQALEARIHEFDAYFATLSVRLDAGILRRAKRLRAIATPSTGLDHIDIADAARWGVEIISLKTDYELLDRITATAEMAWCLLLACVRKLPWAFAAAQRGEWARDRFRGNQLAHKTLGILGYGRLGRMVAEYGEAFRMKVIACDVRDFQAPGVERVDFDTLLAQSDVLSIHIHLTEENRGLISRAALAKMKPGIVLINTSRGAILDEAALLEALSSGKVAAAGLDVIEGEWRADLADHPLIRYARTHENLIISPHLGGVTFESQAMALEHTARKLADFLRRLAPSA